MRISFYLKGSKSWATFCCPLMIWHSQGIKWPYRQDPALATRGDSVSLNINPLTLLGCQAVVAAQHDHVHLSVDQRYIPLYSPTLF